MNELLTRASETTQKWVIENFRRPIGTPEEILENLIQYDDEFSEMWQEFMDAHDWEKADPENEEMQQLLTRIEAAQSGEVVLVRQRIGEMVAKARNEAGLSMRQLAELAGVNFANIYKIEHGKYNVSVDVLDRVLRPLGKKLTIE